MEEEFGLAFNVRGNITEKTCGSEVHCLFVIGLLHLMRGLNQYNYETLIGLKFGIR